MTTIDELRVFLYSRMLVKGPDECWPWIGTINKSHGYGECSIGKAGHSKHWRAHRLSYYVHHGELVAGLVIMHSCDNRPCVNPKHLSQGTVTDNNTDAVNKGRHRTFQKAQTHCKHGHEFTEANTRIRSNCWRQCRKCNVLRLK